METGTVKLWDYSKPIKQRHSGPCGPYQFTRQGLITGRKNRNKGFGGYLSKDGTEVNEGSMVRLRVFRADSVIRLNHDGWYCDQFQDGTMYGVVARLPRSRGFLAGYSMGPQMSTGFDSTIYETADDAARAADSEAETAAEREREYQEKWQADQDAETALTELRDGGP
jgi:hypothetical protein